MLRTLSCVLLAAAGVTADFDAKWYTLDLDKTALERLTPIADELIATHTYEYVWQPMHTFLEAVLPHAAWVEMAPLWAKVLDAYPAFYQEEVRAFYQYLTVNLNRTEWTIGQITMAQLFYEVEDACTSIVAQHTNGTIFHGRNLDYGLPGLSNFTINAKFTRSNQTIAHGTMYLGYSGLLTGQHVEGGDRATWSLSLNERFYGKDWVPYQGTIEEILAGVQNAGFTLRDALMDVPSYEAATALLREKPMPAPAYLTLSGLAAGDGVVITRDRNGTSHAAGTGRGYWKVDTSVGDWYRMETNFDNWEPLTDGRRKVANEGMHAIGQAGANLTGLLHVLETDKVLNSETTYTAMMLNEASYYRTIVREHSDAANAARTQKMHLDVKKKMETLFAWFKQM